MLSIFIFAAGWGYSNQIKSVLMRIVSLAFKNRAVVTICTTDAITCFITIVRINIEQLNTFILITKIEYLLAQLQVLGDIR